MPIPRSRRAPALLACLVVSSLTGVLVAVASAAPATEPVAPVTAAVASPADGATSDGATSDGATSEDGGSDGAASGDCRGRACRGGSPNVLRCDRDATSLGEEQLITIPRGAVGASDSPRTATLAPEVREVVERVDRNSGGTAIPDGDAAVGYVALRWSERCQAAWALVRVDDKAPVSGSVAVVRGDGVDARERFVPQQTAGGLKLYTTMVERDPTTPIQFRAVAETADRLLGEERFETRPFTFPGD